MKQLPDFNKKKQDAVNALAAEETALTLVNELGLYDDNVIYHKHVHGLGFGWRKATTLERAREILEKFPADPAKNQILTFASRDKIETFSPFKIDVSNYKHLNSAQINIKYASLQGYEINIQIAEEEFKESTRVKYIQGDHLGFGKYEQIRVFQFLAFGTVNLYGNGQYLYCKNQEEKEAFEHYIFNGKIQDNESQTNI